MPDESLVVGRRSLGDGLDRVDPWPPATDDERLSTDDQRLPTNDHAAEDDPLWYKDAIIYQAHVRAFFDSTNDGVGDFPGLTQKLDYLQGLGTTCLWLLPFFPSPLRDDGYDIADYRNVHPSYGTLDDFEKFVRAAHERHIKVLIELVINHTSDQHPWFTRARHAPPGSPEREFYVWSDTDKKFPDTRIIFSDAEKSNWTFDPVAGQYFWHRFFSHQPDLNLNNPAVVDAVIDVMKFWLDLGVDALRLDAVPYLCVREGTTNEGLPETHGVLKRMRRELDAAYSNRMLLAEANQWPADVRAYFGEGDECHMAFHFPLMPRMFMALQQEDRHAITEILNQTPQIPETCQWALFLRNHDELTLETVTDEERDYMYSVYAADPQMRVNLGIRRRLAPLLENSRPRIELLTAMLFAFPGTPIVYYGDEIGMGDNIYLGDRNGVRTPMQWSGDRNGGFSKTDPARLYAPLVMDPVYGYQAINVEAQERYPFSLLNWMKRLIAMRKQHRVFGRGSLEFVGCPNRKVLAFLRRDDRETILVVVNLSSTVQPAMLELAAFAGLVPVEMSGLTGFPRIADSPYFLTLGPYASYWFTLLPDPMQMVPTVTASSDPDFAIAESLPSLLVGADWQTLMDSATRTVLERQALVPFLQRQRWFGSRPAPLRHARFSDWTRIRSGPHPSFVTIVSLESGDGREEEYVVPLALLGGEEAERAVEQMPGCVLARMTGARKGAIVDGMKDHDTVERLMAVVTREEEIATPRGSVRGVVQPRDRTEGWDRLDQSALRLFRRIEPGPNPEFEIGRALAQHGFTRTPALIGWLEYSRPGRDPATLALVQTVVKHQGTGWEYTIDELRRYYERVAVRARSTQGQEGREGLEAREGLEGRDPSTLAGPPPFFAEIEHLYLRSAAVLGRRTAELHLALADAQEPAFRPEPLDLAALGALADAMRAHAETVLDLLDARRHTLQPRARSQAETLIAARAALVARFDEIRALDAAGLQIRIHGDYHLGQVLRAEEDFFALGFEGDPERPLADRRARQSPLKDVAGMLRSFSYAAYATLVAFTVHAPDDFSLLEPWAAAWQHWVSDGFLREYRSTIAGTPLAPGDDAFAALLGTLTLDKALYELAHELDNRPEWVRIPLVGLLNMVSPPSQP
jgi:maltose alpha-D-glucosyltransferase/alpha-amylase